MSCSAALIVAEKKTRFSGLKQQWGQRTSPDLGVAEKKTRFSGLKRKLLGRPEPACLGRREEDAL